MLISLAEPSQNLKMERKREKRVQSKAAFYHRRKHFPFMERVSLIMAEALPQIEDFCTCRLVCEQKRNFRVQPCKK